MLCRGKVRTAAALAVPILINATRGALIQCAGESHRVLTLAQDLQYASGIHSAPVVLAGHNKWSKIKRKKEVADRERSKFTAKLVSQISLAVRTGGNADPDLNIHLSSAISRAKNAGVPKSTIENAIKVGSNKRSAVDAAESVLYEGRGPSGYLLLIEALTVNRKRVRPIVRHILEEHG